MKIVTAYDLGVAVARKHIAQTKMAFELGTGSALFKSAAPEPPMPPQTVPREEVTYDDNYVSYQPRPFNICVCNDVEVSRFCFDHVRSGACSTKQI